jgi:hypothetical protein
MFRRFRYVPQSKTGNFQFTDYYEKGVKKMENKNKNSSIKCSVSQCQHNMVTENYCSLNCISVGTHEANPTVPECTDCNSFVKRTGCCG